MLSKAKKYNFTSKIQINAKTDVTFEKIKSYLINHKNLKLIKDGDSLIYLIKNTDIDYYSTLELFKNKIAFITYSNSFPSLYSYDSMMKLILLLSFMKDIYTIELADLYPYLIEFFRNASLSNKSNFEVINDKSKNINPPELILSERNINLLKENKSLTLDLSKKKSEIILLFHKFILLKYPNRVNVQELSKDLGFDENHLKKLISELITSGVLVKWLNKNDFALVK